MAARDPNKREFVMLAGTFDPESDDPTGWYMSEKLDGMRCFWDGGISRGLQAGEVPYANCVNGDEDHACTGLWSRGGKVIHAPEWFIRDLPKKVLLDGELWNKKMILQEIVSVTRAHNKDEEWEKLHYMVFDNPSHPQFFRTGRVHIGDWEAQLPEMKDWAISRGIKWRNEEHCFEDFVDEFVDGNISGTNWMALPQKLVKDTASMHRFLDKVVKDGGEGIMLRRPESVWNPRRAREDLVKVKRFFDNEAEIIGYTFGKITKKDSRLRGKLGALVVRELDTGCEFELAGLNDSERGLEHEKKGGIMFKGVEQYAWDHPGELAPGWIGAASFELGQKITFKYWDRTKDGVPKFAQYFRVKVDE